jgi:DNA-binding NarL/FixJ family response regulator
VLDSGLFDFACKEKIEYIQSLLKKMPIMVVLNDQDNLLLFQLIDHDFTVIVSRDVCKEEWLKGLEMAKQQKVFFSQQIAIRVAALSVSMEDIYLLDKVNGLSAYDKYILIRICQEAPSKQIAFELGNSKRTIEGHRTKMMQLFEVKNVAGLVKIACTTKLYDHYLSNPGLYSKTLCAKTSAL